MCLHHVTLILTLTLTPTLNLTLNLTLTLILTPTLTLTKMPLGFGEEASDGSFTHYNRGLEVGLEPWAHHPPGVANMCTWDVPWDSPCRDATKLLRIAETISCWDGGYDEILDELLDDEEAEAEAAAAEEEAEEAEGEEEGDPSFWLCCDAEDAMFGKVLMATGKPNPHPHPHPTPNPNQGAHGDGQALHARGGLDLPPVLGGPELH